MWCCKRLCLAAALSLALVLSACGYNFSATAPIVLPQEMNTLHLGDVTDPTTEAWLESTFRSHIRDEFTRRGDVSWKSAQRADGQLRVEIFSFSSAGKLETAEEVTVRSEITMRFRGRIFDLPDQSLVWESQDIGVSVTYSEDRQHAEQRAVRRAAEKLADQLSRQF